MSLRDLTLPLGLRYLLLFAGKSSALKEGFRQSVHRFPAGLGQEGAVPSSGTVSVHVPSAAVVSRLFGWSVPASVLWDTSWLEVLSEKVEENGLGWCMLSRGVRRKRVKSKETHFKRSQRRKEIQAPEQSREG